MIWKFKLHVLSEAETFLKIKQFRWFHLKICTAPIINNSNFRKNKIVLLMWLYNLSCPYSFNDITWKFALPLLSRARIFAKIPQVTLLEYLNCPYTTRKIFHKNKAVLLMWLENLACPYYRKARFWQKKAVLLKWFENLNCSYNYKLKFLRKQGSFVEAIRKFELQLLLRAEIFSKIRRIWWYHLKIWTAPIITS